MGSSQNRPSRDATSLISDPVPITSDREPVADISSGMVEETSTNTPPGDEALLTKSLSLVAPDVGKVTSATVEEATLPPTTSDAFQKGKGQVNV